MTVLFFMWGFMTVFNDILIPRFKEAFTLNYTEAMLVQFCFFGAYFIGSLAYFGTYSVDSAKLELALHVKRCLFPNWNGADRKASLTLSDSTLDLTSAVEPSLSGSYYSHSVWKRVE